MRHPVQVRYYNWPCLLDTGLVGLEAFCLLLQDQHSDKPSDGDDESPEEDSRLPIFPSPTWQPVRASAPPPVVDWDLTYKTFGFFPPADYGNLRIRCAAPSVVNNRPPPSDQLPVLRAAVASMAASGILKRTRRGPYLSPIQLAPKSTTESRFILDASHLTPHLAAPPFRLDPLPKVLLQVPLPPNAYFTKVDLAEAFYHVSLHPSAQKLTTFRLDGAYFTFTRLPFGLRPAPFLMQSLATALAHTLRSRGIWAWAYIDNFLLAHPDPSFLQAQTQLFVRQLTSCGFRINPKDTTLVPSKSIKFLGFRLDSVASTIGHTSQRIQSLADTLPLLRSPCSRSQYRRLAGLWAFYFSLYHSGYSALRPLFNSALTSEPPPLQWLLVFKELWHSLPHTLPLVPQTPVNVLYADASNYGLGVVTPTSTLAILTSPDRHIYLREAIAWTLAALLAPTASLIFTDNKALRCAITECLVMKPRGQKHADVIAVMSTTAKVNHILGEKINNRQKQKK